MAETDVKPRKLVREFRQLLVWPIQLMPLRANAQIQEHWEALSQPGAEHPWRELRDEFDCDPAQFQQRHYSEFVTFLPYVRRFLYGEGKGRTGAGVVDSPIRVFLRNDVAAMRATLPGAEATTITMNVAHVDLCFFYDIDVVILIVEVFANDLTLVQALDMLHRFGRGYPTYWHEDGTGGHCLARAEWLGPDGAVLATSDFEQRSRYLEFVGRYRAPRFAAHWTYLLKPIVPDHSDEKGLIRFRQIEYSRMPVLAYLAMDNARELSRADFVRLGLVTGAGAVEDDAPYSSRYLRDFEGATATTSSGTRTARQAGHAPDVVRPRVRHGRRRGRSLFRRSRRRIARPVPPPVFPAFLLIPHIHKATLLMLSDRMVDALNHLDIRDGESVKRFKRTIRQLREIFLRFTHRYWFHEVSDQPQAKELYRMTSNYLGSDRLYDEIREELGDMANYLESDTLRRQANTVVRLTVVTAFGLVGTIVTGFLGMNLLALAEAPLWDRIGYFLLVLIPTTLLTFYTIVKSKRLSDFLEALSDERLPASAKFRSLLDVWKKDPDAAR